MSDVPLFDEPERVPLRLPKGASRRRDGDLVQLNGEHCTLPCDDCLELIVEQVNTFYKIAGTPTTPFPGRYFTLRSGRRVCQGHKQSRST